MNHFKLEKTENGYGKTGLVLERVLSITRGKNNKIIFREECDGYFTKELSKEDAVNTLNEAIDWINEVEKISIDDFEKTQDNDCTVYHQINPPITANSNDIWVTNCFFPIKNDPFRKVIYVYIKNSWEPVEDNDW